MWVRRLTSDEERPLVAAHQVQHPPLPAHVERPIVRAIPRHRASTDVDVEPARVVDLGAGVIQDPEDLEHHLQARENPQHRGHDRHRGGGFGEQGPVALGVQLAGSPPVSESEVSLATLPVKLPNRPTFVSGNPPRNRNGDCHCSQTR